MLHHNHFWFLCCYNSYLLIFDTVITSTFVHNIMIDTYIRVYLTHADLQINVHLNIKSLNCLSSTSIYLLLLTCGYFSYRVLATCAYKSRVHVIYLGLTRVHVTFTSDVYEYTSLSCQFVTTESALRVSKPMTSKCFLFLDLFLISTIFIFYAWA